MMITKKKTILPLCTLCGQPRRRRQWLSVTPEGATVHQWCEERDRERSRALATRRRDSGKNPGMPYRIQTFDNGFDELVLGDWLHVERMNHRTFWMRLGERVFDITIAKDGTVTSTERPEAD
jgi:hypothetical protein